MIVKLDNDGVALADDKIESWVAEKFEHLPYGDIHVSNVLTIQCIRYLLHKMDVADRPDVTWIFYGDEVNFDQNLKSYDAWHHDTVNLIEKFLMELL